MRRARDPAATQFSRLLAVETPEHVVIQLELAGLGSRLAAASADLFLLFLGEWLLSVVMSASGDAYWLRAVGVAIGFAIFWGYFVLFETFNSGRTPGKQLLGIRVVMETGHPVTWAAAVVRNLVRFVDGLTFFFLGFLMVLFHPQNKRLGDIAAGTIVVRERPSDVTLGRPTAAAAAEPLDVIEPGIPQLSDEEFRLLGQVLDRLENLEPDRQARFVAELMNRFAARFPDRDPDALVFLAGLHAEELTKRRGRGRSGPGGTVTVGSGERFVTRKRDGWERFRLEAVRVERVGLKSLAPPQLLEFVARYREVAADLARARTYGAEERVLEYLGRVVTAGHNAVYGLRSVRRRRIGQLIAREFPAAVFAARAYVVTASLLFAVPAVAGYSLIRAQPDLAYEVMPPEMIARAEEGQSRQAEGIGYAEQESPFLPLMASGIIANNVQIAFVAFAFGILGGVGTAVTLILNGMFFGAVVGLFSNYHLAGWLLTFVVGHGVLELTAIFVAGGAGLMVARALIAPGDLTRHDALIVSGRLAVRLVGAATCMLVLAGTIEGFESASDAPVVLKYLVSSASVVLLGLYLANGYRYLKVEGKAPRQDGRR
ncbi:MAG TPA: stage II sporulation protein M [Gemmatimonadales bacterium]|nr:stage II sporulation protein M [Gemmatimonadales bacterium]